MPLSPVAYLLVTHGSRDPRSPWMARQLAERVQYCLQASTAAPLWVETASLELADVPLHQRIQQLGDRLCCHGGTVLQIVPLFLLPGVHVRDDIPAEVAIAQAHLPTLDVQICPYLGSHPHMGQLLQRSFDPRMGSRVLVSHGSRRAGGNAPIEAIAAQLGALPAYWSVAPSLAQQVEQLLSTGTQAIAILPYFLFAGGITDAIAQQVHDLAQRHPTIQFSMAEPLGATAEVAHLVAQLSDRPAPDRYVSC